MLVSAVHPELMVVFAVVAQVSYVVKKEKRSSLGIEVVVLPVVKLVEPFVMPEFMASSGLEVESPEYSKMAML